MEELKLIHIIGVIIIIVRVVVKVIISEIIFLAMEIRNLMKKNKSDQAIINTWIEDMRLMFYPYLDDNDLPFKPTATPNCFEINMGGNIFIATFTRKT
jgi:hypothetical protein